MYRILFAWGGALGCTCADVWSEMHPLIGPLSEDIAMPNAYGQWCVTDSGCSRVRHSFPGTYTCAAVSGSWNVHVLTHKSAHAMQRLRALWTHNNYPFSGFWPDL